MASRLKIALLSFACCNPSLAVHDERYIKVLKEALERTGAEADIDIAHVTEALMSMQYAYMSDIVPLFKKYGAAVGPALFINEKLTLYGGVPTVEKLSEVIKEKMEEQANSP